MISKDGVVLIVEDNLAAAMGAKLIIKRAGYTQSEHVTTGEEAIELTKAKTYSLILMDIGLAGQLDGAETTHEIRKIERELKRKPCPIIAVTGHVEANKVPYYKEMGLDEVIEKPLNIDKLNNILK